MTVASACPVWIASIAAEMSATRSVPASFTPAFSSASAQIVSGTITNARGAQLGRACGSGARGRRVTTMLRAGSSSTAEVHALAALRRGADAAENVALLPQQHRDRFLPARRSGRPRSAACAAVRSPRAPRARSPADSLFRSENHSGSSSGDGEHAQGPARPDLGEVGGRGHGRPATKARSHAPEAAARRRLAGAHASNLSRAELSAPSRPA